MSTGKPTAAELMTGKATAAVTTPRPAARTRPAPKPAPPAAQPAAGKTTRITVDLDPARYTALNRWLAAAAADVSPDARRVSASAAIRAMIDACTLDKSIGLVVIDLLRRNLT